MSAADQQFMARALELARKGLYSTHPNPRVGCVIAREGKIVGEGWHAKAGEPHAEGHALRQAGDKARGATAYVTLEPCSHHGRTPPCADALVAAGVARVVAAMQDPNPEVSGKGLLRLMHAGIAVHSGVLEAEARALNAGFIKRMEQGLPYVRVKLAMSLDGRTAMANGESQWITGPEARAAVQRLRARASVIITGADTVLTDQARLTVRAEELGLKGENILLSCKVSGVQDLIAVYRELARRCDYALHLGLTEAGMGTKGVVASATALSILLQEGIGDTIRVSLTPQPGEARTQEVVVAAEILQSLGLRAFVPSVTACPGCGRTTSTTFQELAKQIDDYLRAQMPVWRERYPGVEKLKVAVMGCIVNGPGESKHADIGISLPGTGEAPAAPVFIDGEKALTLRGEGIATEFQALVQQYIERRFGGANKAA